MSNPATDQRALPAAVGNSCTAAARSAPRIVHIIDRLPPDGAERLLVEILKHRNQQFDYRVLCLIEGGPLLEDIEKLGVPVSVLGRRHGLDVAHAAALWRWLREFKPDIAHTHLFTADAWGRLFAWLTRVPGIFTTVHSTNSWKKRHHLITDRVLATVSDHVIACTDGVRQVLATQGLPRRKLRTVNNAVDLDRTAEATALDLTRAFGISYGTPVFALAGRLHPAKGHADLLDAIAILAQEEQAFHCLFVGEGELEQTLRQQVAARGLDSRVTFTGFRRDVLSILKAVDFLVMPSHWEGLPMSLLESMACETPAVATRVGGIPDVIEHEVDGLLLPAKNPAALADAIRQMLTEPAKRKQMALAGRHKVEEQFSAEAATREYERLYMNVLRRHQPRTDRTGNKQP